ncbi:MAG: hypothetical protein DRP08_07295 [Candidatus Aenigmatarchaeota archaeon]|nr:MAG: hypothetical protein DRP08_07295 [Candidatus Aenigmarchaeota archaeon]
MSSETPQVSSRIPSWEEIEVLKKKLQKLKAVREEQYTDMNLYGKCMAIAEELGNAIPQKHGTYWEYKDGDLEIGYDSYGRNLHVCWRNRLVLKVQLGTLKLFRLGPWVHRIHQLALKANQIADERERIHQFKELMEELKNWEEAKE